MLANTTLKNWGFIFLIAKKRKGQAMKHACAEPENAAEMKHTVPVILFLYIA